MTIIRLIVSARSPRSFGFSAAPVQRPEGEKKYMGISDSRTLSPFPCLLGTSVPLPSRSLLTCSPVRLLSHTYCVYRAKVKFLICR